MTNAVLWTSAEAAQATGGRATAKFSATSVSIDSRTINKGDLYIALKGENFDGHDFVQAAVKNGAAAAVVSHVPMGLPDGFPLLVVEDTFEALKALAAFARKRSSATVVGVTGSVGKTTTKELLQITLQSQGKTYCTVGNLNNHIGVPLSLSRMPADADFAIFEMGMNHAGEISPLTKLARPHVTIISTVEAVHLEFFASVEKIADAKSEIFEGLELGGAAILNKDNPYYNRMKENAEHVGVKNILSFGKDNSATVSLKECKLSPKGTEVKALAGGKEYAYTIGMMGEHVAKNSLAVLAALRYIQEQRNKNLNVEQAFKVLVEFTAPAGRGKLHTLPCAGGTFTLIDDSYNASPASITAALTNLALCKSGQGRTVAALGDMLELGSESVALHKNLAEVVKAQGIDRVHTAGNLMKNVHDAIPGQVRGIHTDTSAQLLPLLQEDIRAGDVVLVKGSHGSGMYRLVEAMLKVEAV